MGARMKEALTVIRDWYDETDPEFIQLWRGPHFVEIMRRIGEKYGREDCKRLGKREWPSSRRYISHVLNRTEALYSRSLRLLEDAGLIKRIHQVDYRHCRRFVIPEVAREKINAWREEERRDADA